MWRNGRNLNPTSCILEKRVKTFDVSISKIRKFYPYYKQKVYFILDGAGYHCSQWVKDWTEVV